MPSDPLTAAELAEAKALAAMINRIGIGPDCSETDYRVFKLFPKLLAEVDRLGALPEHWANAHDERVRQIDDLEARIAELESQLKAARENGRANSDSHELDVRHYVQRVAALEAENARLRAKD